MEIQRRGFYGGVGSVILVDTSGFHKGDVLNHTALAFVEFVDGLIIWS